MKSMPRKTFRILSVMVAVCLFQVYVLAGTTTPSAVATNPNASSLLLGRLMLAGTETILVNGNSANSGTTILSGSQLRTPADVQAMVQLGSAGKLYIDPSTSLTVTFDKTNIDVKVAAGHAFVTANAGVVSSVTNPNASTSAEPAAPAPGWDDWSDGEKAAAVLLPIIAGVIIIYLVTKDDGSNS